VANTQGRAASSHSPRVCVTSRRDASMAAPYSAEAAINVNTWIDDSMRLRLQPMPLASNEVIYSSSALRPARHHPDGSAGASGRRTGGSLAWLRGFLQRRERSAVMGAGAAGRDQRISRQQGPHDAQAGCHTDARIAVEGARHGAPQLL